MLDKLRDHSISMAGASGATLVAVAMIWGADIRAGAGAAVALDSTKEAVEQMRQDFRWYMEQMGLKPRPGDSVPVDTVHHVDTVFIVPKPEVDSSDSGG